MNHPDQTSTPALLDAAEAIVRQIESLADESSVIDEDLQQGEPLSNLRTAIQAVRTKRPTRSKSRGNVTSDTILSYIDNHQGD